MKARAIGIILFAVVLAAAPAARQQAGATGGQTPPTAKPPAPRRAVTRLGTVVPGPKFRLEAVGAALPWGYTER